MQSRARYILAGIGIALSLSSLVSAAEKASPNPVTAPSELRELWVPTESLETILARHPDAVLLDPKQYRALITDAIPARPEDVSEKTQPPLQEATLESLSIRTSITEGSEIDSISGDVRLVFRNHTKQPDGWAHIDLPRLPGSVIATVGKTLIVERPSADGKSLVYRVHLQGPGIHRVTLKVRLPTAGQKLALSIPPASASSLTIAASPAIRFGQRSAVSMSGAKTVHRFALPNQGVGNLVIPWSLAPIAPLEGGGIQQQALVRCSVSESQIDIAAQLRLASNTTRFEDRDLSIQLPEGYEVTNVEGEAVASWSRVPGADILNVRTVSSEHGRTAPKTSTNFVIQLVRAVELGAAESLTTAPVAIPIFVGDDFPRATATYAFVTTGNVRIAGVDAGPESTQSHAIPEMKGVPAHPGAEFVTGYSTDAVDPESPPTISLKPVQPRFGIDLDSLVKIGREGIVIERHLSHRSLEGSQFESVIQLPEGETFVGVKAVDGTALGEWQETTEGIRILWPAGVHRGGVAKAVIHSEIDPEGWFDLGSTPMDLSVTNAVVAGAEKVSGYVAVHFGSMFAVTSPSSTGLSMRDGRVTPVKGNYAWFRLNEFDLQLSVAKRPPTFSAEITAYALPLVNTLQIEGQIDLEVTGSSLREFEIALPEHAAPHLRFDSSVVAETVRDETPDGSGNWKIRFHQPLRENASLRFHLRLPLDRNLEDERRFAIELPTFQLPGARRISGQWMTEANTDTELTFKASGIDRIDSLQAPEIADYQPTHRVIAAFRYRGDAYQLGLSGVRHEPVQLITTVCDRIELHSVLDPDGTIRTQADLLIRSSSAQFLDIELPEESELLTLTLDGQPTKPVSVPSGKPGLRVALDAKTARMGTRIRVIYEEARNAWGGSGKQHLVAPQLAPEIPVMETQWFAHLPEGYSARSFRSNLTERFVERDEVLVSRLFRAIDDGTFFDGNPILQIAISSRSKREYAAATDEVYKSASKADYAYQSGPQYREGEEDDQAMSINFGRTDDHEISKKMVVQQAAQTPNAPRLPAPSISTNHSLSLAEIPQIDFEGSNEKMNLGTTGSGKSFGAQKMIPTFELKNASLQEAIAEIRKHAPDLDIQLEANNSTGPITLSLKNVPLQDALRYVTDLAGARYTANGNVVLVSPITDLNDDLYTQAFRVSEHFITSAPQSSGGQIDPFSTRGESAAVNNLQTAADFLQARGITMPEGSTALYNPETGTLTIRNTKSNIDLAASLISNSGSPTQRDASRAPMNSIRDRVSGLIPISFELPQSGQTYRFEGQTRPAELKFRYTAWERESSRGWLFIALGGVLFWRFARRSPWFWGILIFLCLTLIPLGLGESCPGWLINSFNALLIGWTTAALIRFVVGLGRRLRSRIGLKTEVRATAATAQTVVGLAVLWAIANPADSALAEQAKPIPAPPTVIVSFAASEADLEAGILPDAQGFYLDRATFDQLWEQAKTTRQRRAEGLPAIPDPDAVPDLPDSADLLSALYNLRLEGDQLVGEVSFHVRTVGDGWHQIPFGYVGAEVTPADWSQAVSQTIALIDGKLVVKGATNNLLRFDIRVPAALGADANAPQRFVFSGPKATFGLATVGSDRDVKFQFHQELTSAITTPTKWPPIKPSPSSAAAEQRPLPTTAAWCALRRGKIELSVSPRETTSQSRARSGIASATTTSFLNVGPTHEQIDFQMQTRLPAGHDGKLEIKIARDLVPTHISAPNLKNWNLSSDASGLSSLELEIDDPENVDFAKVERKLLIRVSAVRSGLGADTDRTFPLIYPVARRLTEKFVLAAGPGHLVKATPSDQLARIAPPAMPQPLSDLGKINSTAQSAFESNGGTSGATNLNYRLEARESDRKIDANYVYQFGQDQMEIVASLTLHAGGAPIADVVVDLPEGVAIQTVQGTTLTDHWTGTDGKLNLRFANPIDCDQLLIYLAGNLPAETAPGQGFPLPQLSFPDFDSVKGTALIACHASRSTELDLKVRRTVAREIRPEDAAPQFAVLDPIVRRRGIQFDEAPFDATLRLVETEPAFHGTTTLLTKVHDTWIACSAHIQLDVEQGAIQTVDVMLPNGLSNVRIYGEAIREFQLIENPDAVATEQMFRVSFQSDITSDGILICDFEIPHSGTAQVPQIGIGNATRTERFVVLENRSEHELRSEITSAQRVPERMLPFLPEGASPDDLFRLETGGSLKLTLDYLETTAGTEAVILFAELESAVQLGGWTWTRASYRIQNRSLQFLPVSLPDGSELASVTVDGVSTRADLGADGVFLVPLIQTDPGQLSYNVDLVYRQPTRMKGKRLDLELEDPDIGRISVERTMWKVSLPPGYDPGDVDGNMRKADAELSIQEKLKTAMGEISRLNKLASSDGYGAEVREKALFNASNLMSEVRSNIKSRESQRWDQRSYEGKDKDLERLVREQEIILTDNQINQAVFAAKNGQIESDISKAASGKGYDEIVWYWNGKGKGEVQTKNNEQVAQQAIDGGGLNINDNLVWSVQEEPKKEAAAQKKKVVQQQPNAYSNARGNRFNAPQSSTTPMDGKPGFSKKEQLSKDNPTLIAEANANYDVGNYSEARELLGNALINNRFDASARELLLRVEEQQSAYTLDARSQTRAKMLRDVDTQWETAANGLPSDFPVTPATGLISLRESLEEETAYSPGGRISLPIRIPVAANVVHFQKLKSDARIEVRGSAQDSGQSTWFWWAILGVGIIVLLVLRSKTERR